MSQSTDKTIYILDTETNTFIPYRPDYSAGVPLVTPEAVTRAQTKPRAPKTDKQLGVIVPLIKQRPNQSDYVQLATIAQKYPRVNTIAIISPSNDERGIGDIGGPDPEYQNAIRFLQANGVQVVGYVNIDASKKTPDEGKREVDRWQQWYPDVNGIFFDYVLDYEDCRTLSLYAKIDKAFQLTIANLSTLESGGVVNSTIDFVRAMDSVDIFVVYEREGYPADGWYVNLKKDWMPQYPRSRFAFIPYRVPEDTLTCRNFIDKVVGIEKLAGYVYIHSAHETDRRRMREWTNISSLLEITLDQLDRMAQQEGIPSTKGVVPDTMKPVITTQGEALTTRTDDSVTLPPSPEEGLRVGEDMDKFGVRKIYPNAKDKASKEWYVFMDNPRADSRLKGLPDKLEKQADGSWQTQDKKVILAATSPKDNTRLNVEITGYFKVVQLPKKGRDVIHLYAGRGLGESSGYVGQLLKDGAVTVAKVISASKLTGDRGTTQATNNDLLNRWIGMKFMVYNNLRINQRTNKEEIFVTMEIWVDDNVNDADKNLVVKNDWRHVMTVHDQGGWFAKDNNNEKKGKKRVVKKDDKILISPGNNVIWSWFDSVINWKFLSVREIDIVHRD